MMAMVHIHLAESPSEIIDALDLCRVLDRDHVRPKSNQFAVFLVKRDVNIMSSVAAHPQSPRNVCPGRKERTWNVAQTKVAAQEPCSEQGQRQGQKKRKKHSSSCSIPGCVPSGYMSRRTRRGRLADVGGHFRGWRRGPELIVRAGRTRRMTNPGITKLQLSPLIISAVAFMDSRCRMRPSLLNLTFHHSLISIPLPHTSHVCAIEPHERKVRSRSQCSPRC